MKLEKQSSSETESRKRFGRGTLCNFYRAGKVLLGKGGQGIGPAAPTGGLLGVDVQDPNLRKGTVPIAGDGVEDQPEVALGARREGVRGDRL